MSLSTVTLTGRSVHAVCYIRLGARYALLGALLFVSQLSALNPRLSITQYAHSVWTRQGSRLPGSVFTLAQTPDGKLWIGTEFGLLEFDGVRFLPWQPPVGQQLTSDYINALGTARDGSLWIGTRAGLSHWTGSTVQNYRTGKSSAGPAVST